MDDTYPIESKIPARDPPLPLNIEKTRASLALLKRKGEGFTIPADELRGPDGTFKSTPIGQRIHRLAKGMGLRVSTTKLHEGLRVRREK